MKSIYSTTTTITTSSTSFLLFFTALAVIISVGNLTESASLCDTECVHGYCDRNSNTCTCDTGYTGDNCDQCEPAPGCVNGHCNKPNECICEDGFTGDLCNKELAIDYCETYTPCRNNGTCYKPPAEQKEQTRPFYCLCGPMWTGSTCDVPLGATTAPEVEMTVCENGGTCVQNGGHGCTKCTCPDGYDGDFCEWEKCSPTLCPRGRDCHMKNGVKRCSCSPGYAGACQDDVCSMNGKPCLNGGRCINDGTAEEKYRCACANGYTGLKCESRQNPTKIVEPIIRPVVQGLPQTSQHGSEPQKHHQTEISSSHQIRMDSGRVTITKEVETMEITGHNIDIQSIKNGNDIHSSVTTNTSSDKSHPSTLKSVCFALLGVAICLVLCVAVFLAMQKVKSYRRRRRSSAVRRAGDGEEYQLRETTTSKGPEIKSTSMKVVIQTERDVLVQRPSAVPGKAVRENYFEGKALLHSPSSHQCSSTKQSCLQQQQDKKVQVKSSSPLLCSSHAFNDDVSDDDITPPPSSNGGRRHYLPDVTIV